MINTEVSLDDLNRQSKNTMMEHLGIVYTRITNTSIEATMPVDNRTVQPYRLLHGGASVVLAETLGSVGANLCIDTSMYYCVGLEINANHLKSVSAGIVTGVANPISVGKKIQVWEIRIEDEKKHLICISRITLAVLEKRND